MGSWGRRGAESHLLASSVWYLAPIGPRTQDLKLSEWALWSYLRAFCPPSLPALRVCLKDHRGLIWGREGHQRPLWVELKF